MLGQTFGYLTVLSYSRKSHGQWYMNCKCECGNLKEVRDDHLKSGKTESCHNCNLQEKHLEAYRSWDCMLSRCTNPKAPNYKRYGGKGIKVCQRWGKFRNFLADMGDPPVAKDSPYRYTLDRIDSTGDYTPDNCRWASKQAQANNTSRNI